ncbi:MAG: Ig-like domain-containing protein, partial [Mycobacterium sp.]
MSAANVIGRLGPLAAALGIGAALAVGTATVAAADPAESGDSASSASSASSAPAPASAAKASAARGAGRGSGRPVSERPAAAAAVERAPRETQAETQAPAVASRTAAPSAAQSSGLLGRLTVLFNNQTPRMSPTQTAQGPTGVVTGALNAVDPDSPQLRFTVTAEPDRGTAAVAADGTWTYTPDPALAATGVTDTFEVQVSDAPSGFAIHGLPGLLHLLS